MRDFAVLVHARAAVAVEFAKRHVAGVLVQEDVEAGEGQQRVVAARDQDELGQARVVVEDLAVFGVVEVVLHDLA